MAAAKELARLRLHKQALLLESDLNRLALRAEWEQLRAATAHASDPMVAWRKISPWLPLLAPLAGFLAVRTLRRPGSVLGGVISAVKWIQPLYSLWRRLASRQHREETQKTTTSVSLPRAPAVCHDARR